MDSNLTNKLTRIETNISTMKDNFNLTEDASIEVLKDKVLEVRRIKPMSFSFEDCQDEVIENLDLLDISAYPNLSNMFDGCSKVKNLNVLRKWDVSQVRDMGYAFHGCDGITDFSFLNDWNASNVTDTAYLFARCDGITEIDLNWTFNSTSLIEGMFYSCKNLKKVRLRNATFASARYASALFRESDKLEEIDIRSAVFSTRSSISCDRMFFYIPANCLIIVKDDAEKNWVLTQRSDLTNVKTVVEYEALN